MSIALGARHRASSLPSLLDFLFSYFCFSSSPHPELAPPLVLERDREETDTRRRNGKGKKNVEKNKWRDEADGSMSIFVLIADQRIKWCNGRRLKPNPYHGNLEIEGCLHSRWDLNGEELRIEFRPLIGFHSCSWERRERGCGAPRE